MKKLNIALSIAMLLYAIAYSIEAMTYDMKFESTIGPGFMPMLFAICLIAMSIIYIVIAFRMDTKEEFGLKSKEKLFAVYSLLIMVGYVIFWQLKWPLEDFNFLIFTPMAMIATFCLYDYDFEVNKLKYSIPVALVFTACIYLVFGIFLGVKL